jgi:hypothetical protein
VWTKLFPIYSLNRRETWRHVADWLRHAALEQTVLAAVI